MAFENIRIETHGHIAVLTLDRPPANPVNLATVEEIGRALDTLEADTAVRVVIITGAGEKGFCAGFDVSDFANAEKVGPMGQAAWTRIDRFAKPVIAAINGFAFGGGCELALACTFRIMTDSPKAKIGLTELNLGIIPGWGGTQRLSRIVGKAKALDLILFSRRLTAVQAHEIGLVDRVSPPGRALEDALEMATALAKRPPIAVSCVIKAMTAGQDFGIDKGLAVELEGSRQVAASEDAREGFTAFLEKREPVFKGE
ncbi:MAG: enoyl-CoA hydratase/isomerase family protein [Desulfobacterales bacterium]|nr:enoyl-CoA hydratase/isomerase family protein [Desulfobacterales bacterium]